MPSGKKINKQLKLLKNIDYFHRALLVKAFCLPFFYLSVLTVPFLGAIGLIYVALISLPVSVLTVFLAGKFGSISGSLYGGREPIYTILEKYSGDLSRARVQKRNGEFEQALIIIENILDEQPDFNEALFLKTQILCEGFKQIGEAKKCIADILKTEPKNTTLHQWSESLYRELIKIEDKR